MPKQFPDVGPHPYGAPMGRRESCDNPTAKVHMFRVRFVGGDYDDGGAYWGGRPSQALYCARGEGVLLFKRADDRDDAKSKIRSSHPGLRFFR